MQPSCRPPYFSCLGTLHSDLCTSVVFEQSSPSLIHPYFSCIGAVQSFPHTSILQLYWGTTVLPSYIHTSVVLKQSSPSLRPPISQVSWNMASSLYFSCIGALQSFPHTFILQLSWSKAVLPSDLPYLKCLGI